jgi:hypothetical protein
MSTLIQDVLDAVSRTLRPAERLHFHAGADGRPHLCEYVRCTSPGLGVARD